MIRRPPRSTRTYTLFPYTTLFRSSNIVATVGPNNPDYSDIVDNTGTQDPPTSLTLVETTVLGNDGTVLPAIRASWTQPVANTYVSFYELQYKLSSVFEFDYGLVADSFTATENYRSIANAQTLELSYGLVSEAVSGAASVYSSVSIYGDSTVITGIKELEIYTFRVRAATLTGKASDYITGTINLQGDQTAPAAPENIVATGGIQQIQLDFDLPPDSDLSFVEILEAESNSLSAASLIVKTKSDQHTVTNIPNDTTRYYFLRAVDHSGNASGYTSSVNATTTKVSLADLGSDVTDALAGSSATAFGVQPVTSLPAAGTFVGQIVILTTTNQLYVWTGSAWSTDIFTASSVDPGSITAASFASGVEPISAVTTLPSPVGYTGPSLVFVTSQAKLFRYNSSVPEFTAAVPTGDLTGFLGVDNFANDLRPVEVVSSLPTTNLTEGRVVVLTSDNDKLYRYTGNAWTKAISAVDLDDQIQASNIATDAIIAGKIQAGAVSTAKLAAEAVTAAKVNVSELFADSAVIGAIQTSAITTSAIVSTIGSFEFIDTSNLVAGAVQASKIDVSSLSAISADVGTITAGTINADVIKLDGLTMDTDNNNRLILGGFDAFSHVNANTLGAIEGVGGQDVAMVNTGNLVGSLFVNSSPHHIAKSSSSSAEPTVAQGNVMGGTTNNANGSPLMVFNFTTPNYTGTRKFLVTISLDPIGSFGSGSATMFAFAMRATNSATAYTATSASSYVTTRGTSNGGTSSGSPYFLTDVVNLSGNQQHYIWVFGQLEDVLDGGHPTIDHGFLNGSIQVAGLSV